MDQKELRKNVNMLKNGRVMQVIERFLYDADYETSFDILLRHRACHVDSVLIIYAN